MRAYIEPFVTGFIATERTEGDRICYYDDEEQLLAEAYYHEGVFYSAVFYGERDGEQVTTEQAEEIAKHVQVVFGQEMLVMDSIEQIENEFFVQFKIVEPVYGVLVRGTGMNITISATGFVEEVELQDNDVTIDYPDKLISADEARAILRQQPILTLGIAPELGWQYVYKQNYDLAGIAPDGMVRLWSEDEMMQGAGYEPLPEVADILDLEEFLKGGRSAGVEIAQTEDEKSWAIDSEEQVTLEEKAFVRACKVVKHLVGEQYRSYFVEQYDALKELVGFEEGAFVTFRFVYIYNNISFDFQAISVHVDTETNQILSVKYPFIPYDTFPSLPRPTVTLEEANRIAQQLVDVELYLESDLQDRKKLSFIYLMDYPTSPTGGHIQYVDGFTGEIHWINTGW